MIQFYVSVSRGISEIHIYTDSIEHLRESIRHTGARESAIELVERSGRKVNFDRLSSLGARLLQQWRQTRNQAVEAAWAARRRVHNLNPQLTRTIGYAYEYQR